MINAIFGVINIGIIAFALVAMAIHGFALLVINSIQNKVDGVKHIRKVEIA